MVFKNEKVNMEALILKGYLDFVAIWAACVLAIAASTGNTDVLLYSIYPALLGMLIGLLVCVICFSFQKRG